MFWDGPRQSNSLQVSYSAIERANDPPPLTIKRLPRCILLGQNFQSSEGIICVSAFKRIDIAGACGERRGWSYLSRIE